MENRASQTLLRIFILFLIVYAFTTLLSAAATLTRARDALAAQQERIQTLREENAALQYDIDHARDEESIERLAREKLGLIRPSGAGLYDVGD